jgi:hypothetical protein
MMMSDALSLGVERECSYEDTAPDKWSKRQRIQYLLDHWSDIWEPPIVGALGGIGAGTDNVTSTSAMARHKSVIELAGCLGNLLAEHPIAYRHLKAFRCAAEWRQRRAMIRIKLPSGRWDEIPGWKRERVVPRWVLERYVEEGETRLVDLFQGEVFIPKELWDGLTKPV